MYIYIFSPHPRPAFIPPHPRGECTIFLGIFCVFIYIYIYMYVYIYIILFLPPYRLDQWSWPKGFHGGGNALVVPVFNIRAPVTPTVGFH